MKYERLLSHAQTNFAPLADHELRFVRGIKRRGGKVYAPHARATETGLSYSQFAIEPRSSFDGELSVFEAPVVLLLHNEARNLTAMMERGEIDQVREVLGLTDEDWASQVIEGIANFVRGLSSVAAVRERLSRGEGRPTGESIPDQNHAFWWDRFATLVVADGFVLGQAVARELVKVVGEQAAMGIVGEDAYAREEAQRKGAEMAEAIYVRLLSDSQFFQF